MLKSKIRLSPIQLHNTLSAVQKTCGVTLYCPRGQCILILLAACAKIGGSPSKHQVLEFITERRWFNKNLGEDLKPYPGNSSGEQRWKTLFSWARNDAADHNFIIRGDDGYWPISNQGREELLRIETFLRGNDLPLRILFLATLSFKRYINPEFRSASDDPTRPASIYEDAGSYIPHDIKRLLLSAL